MKTSVAGHGPDNGVQALGRQLGQVDVQALEKYFPFGVGRVVDEFEALRRHGGSFHFEIYDLRSSRASALGR